MLILGFDTSGPEALLTLANGNEVIAERHLSVERTHMEKLLPALDQMLRESRFSLKRVEAVAVGLGPGSFTGTRLGVVVAKILAQTLSIVIVGIPSLDIIGAGVEEEAELVCVVVDARRGEVYSAIYERREGILRRVGDYCATAPEELAGELRGYARPVTLVGDGLRNYGKVFERELGKNFIEASAGLWRPRASSLAGLAWERISSGDTDDLFQLIPIYVRCPDIHLRERRLP